MNADLTNADLYEALAAVGAAIDRLVEAEWWGAEVREISRHLERGERGLLELVESQAQKRIQTDMLLDTGTTTETNVTSAQ